MCSVTGVPQEGLVILCHLHDSFNQADNGWDIRPTQQNLNDTRSILDEIELVDTQIATKNSKHRLNCGFG
jgi:hypothetical protein